MDNFGLSSIYFLLDHEIAVVKELSLLQVTIMGDRFIFQLTSYEVFRFFIFRADFSFVTYEPEETLAKEISKHKDIIVGENNFLGYIWWRGQQI